MGRFKKVVAKLQKVACGTGGVTLFQIRKFRPSDKQGVLRSILALQAHERAVELSRRRPTPVFARTFFTQLQAKSRRHDGAIYVAIVGNEVAGFVSVWTHRSDEVESGVRRAAYVSDLVVLPKYRKAGIGRALMRQAEQYAKALRLEGIALEVLAKNAPARSFYRRDGFREFSVTLQKRVRKKRNR